MHSKFSDRSAEWLLRRFDFPDSYSEPVRLYETLRARGFDFFTLTDHNTIDGCLELAGRPGVFISEEATAYFPEDRCKVHILIWGIDEEQHREINKARQDIFELAAYLHEKKIAHCVAHPFFDVGGRLGPEHIEKLLLLFNHFETVNGLRDAGYSEALTFALDRLTEAQIMRLAEKHGIEPRGPQPWRKIRLGGSDDHGGLFPGSVSASVPESRDAREFLAHVMAGRVEVEGRGGDPVSLAHSLYNTVFHFLRSKFAKNVHGAGDLIERMFSRFLEGKNPTEFSFSEKLGFLAEGIVSGRIFELANPAHAGLWRELGEYFNRDDLNRRLRQITAGIDEPERRAFLMANHVANELAFRFFNKFLAQLNAGNFFESIQAVSGLVPVALSLSPYIYALQTQAPRRKRLRELTGALTGGDLPPFLTNTKRAWFTDTLEDVNGVTTTIRRLTAAGVAAGRDLTVVVSRPAVHIDDIPIKNFPPIGEFELPEYELQKLSFPPVLNILDWVRRERFSEIIVSTPGPVGLCGLLAAKTFGLRVSGIYHTDFPQYVSILTDDSFLETLTWNYMHWFHSQLDTLFVNSEFYRKCWVSRGIPEDRLRILPRGLDTKLFHPSKRDPAFWERFGGARGRVTLVYVGRVSKEKDLDVLAAAWEMLRPSHPEAQLAFVGDGPYLSELKERLPDAIFTGYLSGHTLAAAYASSEIFVFPSTTDTFGNVLLEAQACGLPAVVSDAGGPGELVRDGVDGFVTHALDVKAFAAAVERLLGDPALRERMSAAARDAVKERDWSAAFEKFWEMCGGAG